MLKFVTLLDHNGVSFGEGIVNDTGKDHAKVVMVRGIDGTLVRPIRKTEHWFDPFGRGGRGVSLDAHINRLHDEIAALENLEMELGGEEEFEDEEPAKPAKKAAAAKKVAPARKPAKKATKRS